MCSEDSDDETTKYTRGYVVVTQISYREGISLLCSTMQYGMNFLGGIVYMLLSYSVWYGRICCRMIRISTTAILLLSGPLHPHTTRFPFAWHFCDIALPKIAQRDDDSLRVTVLC